MALFVPCRLLFLVILENESHELSQLVFALVRNGVPLLVNAAPY